MKGGGVRMSTRKEEQKTEERIGKRRKNAKQEYLDSISGEIIEFKRTERYGLIYVKTKELGWKDNQGIQNVVIEDSQGTITVYQRHVLKTWENYFIELCDRDN
jgi:hypothetical protein